MTKEEAIKIINCYDIGFYDLSGEKIPADKLVEAFDMATEALKAGTEMSLPKWIPCSERLPNYRELVLVTTRDLRVNIAYLDTIQENISDIFWSSPLDDWDCALWNITAWMPLPEPWKGGESNG